MVSLYLLLYRYIANMSNHFFTINFVTNGHVKISVMQMHYIHCICMVLKMKILLFCIYYFKAMRWEIHATKRNSHTEAKRNMNTMSKHYLNHTFKKSRISSHCEHCQQWSINLCLWYDKWQEIYKTQTHYCQVNLWCRLAQFKRIWRVHSLLSMQYFCKLHKHANCVLFELFRPSVILYYISNLLKYCGRFKIFWSVLTARNRKTNG